MKKEVKKRKLQLQKKTIFILNAAAQVRIQGGETRDCPSAECPTTACLTLPEETCPNTGLSITNPLLCNGGTLPRTR